MSDAVIIEALGIEEFKAALADAPTEAYKFIRQEHKRFAGRTRKRFIKERMSGPPGISWGGHGRHAKKVGGNVVANAKDEGSLDSMRVWLRLSKFLARHETGATIPGPVPLPLRADIPRWGKKGGGKIEQQYGQRPFRIPGTNILAVNVGGQLVPLYHLQRNLTLPARLGFRAFVRGQLPEFKARTLAALDRGIRAAMEKRMKRISQLVSSVTAA